MPRARRARPPVCWRWWNISIARGAIGRSMPISKRPRPRARTSRWPWPTSCKRSPTKPSARRAPRDSTPSRARCWRSTPRLAHCGPFSTNGANAPRNQWRSCSTRSTPWWAIPWSHCCANCGPVIRNAPSLPQHPGSLRRARPARLPHSRQFRVRTHHRRQRLQHQSQIAASGRFLVR